MPPAPPRIAVDLRALVPAPTGIGVYTRALLLELGPRGRFRYVGMAHREPRHAAELRAARVEIEHRSAPLGVLWQQFVLARQLRAGRIDLLWSPLQTLPLCSPVPAVVTVHDLTPLLFPGAHRFKVRWSQLPFLRASLARARAIVAVSQATAADLRRYFPRCGEKVRVIHEGVEPEFHPAAPDSIAAMRAELDMPEGYIFFAATLEPRKGVDILLDAWELLRREDAATPPLVLAGSYGWRSPQLLRRIEKLRPLGLCHLGRVERGRLIRLFQAARLFVYPSRYEGFGLPPLEALACGVPVIASNSSSLPEVIEDSGILVEPDNFVALAAAMRRVLTDPSLAADLALRGPEQAAKFRWDRAASEMEEVFAAALV